LDIAANFRNLSAEFVALNNRIGSVRMLSVVNVDVRSADSNPADAQQNVVIADGWPGHFRKFDFSRTRHGGAKHFDPPWPIISTLTAICKQPRGDVDSRPRFDEQVAAI
jgi:hypothetical protein